MPPCSVGITEGLVSSSCPSLRSCPVLHEAYDFKVPRSWVGTSFSAGQGQGTSLVWVAFPVSNHRTQTDSPLLPPRCDVQIYMCSVSVTDPTPVTRSNSFRWPSGSALLLRDRSIPRVGETQTNTSRHHSAQEPLVQPKFHALWGRRASFAGGEAGEDVGERRCETLAFKDVGFVVRTPSENMFGKTTGGSAKAIKQGEKDTLPCPCWVTPLFVHLFLVRTS